MHIFNITFVVFTIIILESDESIKLSTDLSRYRL